MSKNTKKWLLPAKCSLCNRTCTEFWGEVADNWACFGHYIIMNSNYESHFIKKDDNGNYIKEEVIRWANNRKDGVLWLKDNQEPDHAPTRTACGEKAYVRENEYFFCEDHWPVEDEA